MISDFIFLKNMMFYKLYKTVDAVNRGYTFNLGEVNEVEEFNETKECTDNAFYVCEFKDVYHWHETLKYDYIGTCNIPERAQVIQLDDKLKVSALIPNDDIKPFKDFVNEFPLEMIKQKGSALELVPVEHRTLEICFAAVQQDGCALQFVPEEHRTPELCLAAVRQNVSALKFVPEELQTPD